MEKKDIETQNELKFDESLISSILNKQDLESLKDNLANLSSIASPKFKLGEEKEKEENGLMNSDKKGEKMLVKRTRRKRKAKAILPYNERTLADIIDDKISGKPTKADVRETLFKHFKAEKVKKKLKDIEVKKEEEENGGTEESEFLEDQDDKRTATLADFFSPKGPQSPKKAKKSKLPTKWDEDETKKFYKVLEIMGLDFTLMEQFFANRTRKQLLRKFHKEKKKNPKLVESTMEKHQKINDSKRRKYKTFLDSHHNNESQLFSENASSLDSLDNVIIFIGSI